MLSAFKCESSCCSSTSTPGASRTRTAASSPPSSTVATRASPCIAILRASFRFIRLIHRRLSFVVGSRILMMNLLHRIHPPVRLSQKPFHVISIFRTKGGSHTQRDNVPATNNPPRLNCRLVEPHCFLFGRFRRKSRGGNHELIPAHARHIVIPAARVLEPRAEFAQQPVALQMSKRIVDLLEAIHIAHHYREPRLHASAPRHFLRQMHEQRARIRQTSQKVRRSRTLRLLIFQRVFHRHRD